MANILGVDCKNITMTEDDAWDRGMDRKFLISEFYLNDNEDDMYCGLENECEVARIRQETKVLEVSENFTHSLSVADQREEEMKNLLAFYIIVNELDSCDLHTVLSKIANTYLTTDAAYNLVYMPD